MRGAATNRNEFLVGQLMQRLNIKHRSYYNFIVDKSTSKESNQKPPTLQNQSLAHSDFRVSQLSFLFFLSLRVFQLSNPLEIFICPLFFLFGVIFYMPFIIWVLQFFALPQPKNRVIMFGPNCMPLIQFLYFVPSTYCLLELFSSTILFPFSVYIWY